MDRDLRQQLMDQARAEAELGWAEGGIPIGAVLATERGRWWPADTISACRTVTPPPMAKPSAFATPGAGVIGISSPLVTTLSPCPMCAGTAVLLGFRRVLIGERRSFAGQESWLVDAGIEVDCLDDSGCMALMERMLQHKPDLWAEDIGH